MIDFFKLGEMDPNPGEVFAFDGRIEVVEDFVRGQVFEPLAEFEELFPDELSNEFVEVFVQEVEGVVLEATLLEALVVELVLALALLEELLLHLGILLVVRQVPVENNEFLLLFGHLPLPLVDV